MHIKIPWLNNFYSRKNNSLHFLATDAFGLEIDRAAHLMGLVSPDVEGCNSDVGVCRDS